MSTTSRGLGTVLVVSLAVAACNAAEVSGVAGARADAGGGAGGAGAGRGAAGGSAGGAGGTGFSVPEAGAGSGGGPGGSGVDPGAPRCAEEVHDGKVLPLDLLFLVDISGSMDETAGTRSKWTAVRSALQAFFKDPASAGMGAGLQVFPPQAKRCMTSAECGVAQGFCEQKGVCGPPAEITTSEITCNAATATTCGAILNVRPCTEYGLCASSGLRCTPVGQPCAGAAGEMCEKRAMYCSGSPPQACTAASYMTPAVAIADLPGNEAMLTSSLNGFVPQGSTPTTPAVTGALAHLRARAMANPARKPVLVLATDGLPSTCDPNNAGTVSAALAAARMATPGVPTYVVGVFTQAQLPAATAALDQMAMGGGTGMPFLLTAGADLGQRFIEALNEIRGRALGCEFNIPAPRMGMLDFGKVNVRINSAGGTEDLRYVGSADRCDPVRGGWYYDVPPGMGTPSRVRLCDATCTKVKTEMGISVGLVFGCATRVD